jgi:hypothetical protein
MEFQSVFTINLQFLVKHFSKILIFKTCKSSYTRPLYITDPQYEGKDQEIQSFCLFLLQIGDFW